MLTDEHLHSPCFWDSTAGYDTLGFIGQFLQATDDFYAIRCARLVFPVMCSQEISLCCKIIKKTQKKKNVLKYKLHQKHITPKRITVLQSSGFLENQKIQNLLPNMELLISEIVAQNLYRDVNDAVQKAFTVLIRGNILRKTKYSINPQMTSNDQD